MRYAAVAFLTFSVACAPSAQPPPMETASPGRPDAAIASTESLDWVKEFDLERTTKIEVERVMPPAQATRVVTDSAIINDVVSAARGSSTLEPRSRCMADYRLTFVIDDKRSEQFFVSCSSTRVSGNQPAWQTRETTLPARIRELLRLE